MKRGIMRNIPGMTIIDCTDTTMLRDLLLQTEKACGMFYFRFPRGANPVTVYGEGSTFNLGKANVIRSGSDVTIIAAGLLVAQAMKAAGLLEREGVSARVVDIFTIKPIDEECIIRCAAQTGAIVTAENHGVINGLGAAVSRVLVMNTPCPIGYRMVVTAAPSLFFVHLLADPAATSWDHNAPESNLHKVWASECTRRGVFMTNHHNHFTCVSMTEGDIKHALEVADDAFKAVKAQF